MIEFFFNHGFILEMAVATGLFVYSLAFRKFGILRLIFILGMLFGVSILWDRWIDITPVMQILKYILLFLGFTGGVMFIFQASFWVSLFYLIGAYAVQHAAYKIGSMIQFLLRDLISVTQSSIIYVAVVIIIFIVAYYVFSRRIKRDSEANDESQEITMLSIVLIIFTTMFQFIFLEYQENLDLMMYIMFGIYDILCCVFVLLIQYGMFRSEKLQHDYDIMEHIMHRQRVQMSTAKEEMDLINLKYHDLKHYLMRFGEELNKDEKEELEQAIAIYGVSLKTGNEALDIILAEKNLVCEKSNITLNCMADGERLSFMHLTDVYSLFGNAIDNAIDAVQEIEDLEKRYIVISVKKVMGMMAIHLENYYVGELNFKKGIPLTTKADKRFHGYGLRSMDLIVKKYNGDMTIGTHNNVFTLDILFPLTFESA